MSREPHFHAIYTIRCCMHLNSPPTFTVRFIRHFIVIYLFIYAVIMCTHDVLKADICMCECSHQSAFLCAVFYHLFD